MTKEHQKIGLLNQINANNKMISIILCLVNEGHGNPRIFESLADIQKINLELSKELTKFK